MKNACASYVSRALPAWRKMKVTDKTIAVCREFRQKLEEQIEEFEKQAGGRVVSIGLSYCPDLTIHQFDVEFGSIVVRAGGRLPF